MRQLVALLALVGLLGGCDASEGLRPIDDVMIVELTEDGRLQLETETYDYCGVPIYVDSQSRPASLHIEVLGAERVEVMCDALIPGTWSVALPEATPIDVSVQHNGETDRYRVVAGDTGRQLEAITSSTTRLGPRQPAF